MMTGSCTPKRNSRSRSVLSKIIDRERFGPNYNSCCKRMDNFVVRSSRASLHLSELVPTKSDLYNVFLGLSHDSRYVVSCKPGCNDSSFFPYEQQFQAPDAVEFWELEPRRMRKRFSVSMQRNWDRDECESLNYVYFDKSSRFSLALSFGLPNREEKKLDTYVTGAFVKLIHFPIPSFLSNSLLEIEAHFNLFLSIRNQSLDQSEMYSKVGKMIRLLPASVGFLINTGMCICSIRVHNLEQTLAKQCGPYVKTMMHTWTAQQLLDDLTESNSIAFNHLSAKSIGTNFPIDGDRLLVVETMLEIEPLINDAGEVVSKSLHLQYGGISDYSIEIVTFSNCGQAVELLIPFVIDVTEADCSTPRYFMNIIELSWNFISGIVEKMEIVGKPDELPKTWRNKLTPNNWRKFADVDSKKIISLQSLCRSPQDYILTTIPLLTGKSLPRLRSYCGCISLTK